MKQALIDFVVIFVGIAVLGLMSLGLGFAINEIIEEDDDERDK